MADVGGDSSGRSHDRYIPSYDAPTAPIPAVRAEDGTMINPRVPRRFPIGDGEETVLVPRPGSTGSSPEAGAETGTEAEPGAQGPEEQESVWLFPMTGFPGLDTTESEAGQAVSDSVSDSVSGTGSRAGSQAGSLSGIWAWDAEPGPAGPGSARSGSVQPFPASGSSRPDPTSSGAARSELAGHVRGLGSDVSPPGVRPGGSPLVPGPPPAPFSPRANPGPGGVTVRKKDGLLMRIGDIPIRFIYSLGAALVTALAVFLIFVLFSGDEPAKPSGADRPDTGTAVRASPSVPPITLPGLPATTVLRVLPGTPSPVLGAMTDSRAAITYAKLGKPWVVADIPSFSAGQQVGTGRQPGTMIASGLLPGAAPQADLKTDAEFRRAAAGAVKWTIGNYYPAGSKVAWTASQKPAAGKGWTLGYRVAYTVKGKRHTSQAALTLLDIGRRKPAMLLITVPDTHRQLWADIAPLVASARAL
ncbi:hypothetical protein AB0395_06155 [Streptosporangium sp. NPDC051023]|uniref:hypothetical protein n=1 Tax=Streptosporangium sp. NPDC051023 TaxID=3155410 RepID=UPI00344BDFD7